MRAYTAVVCLIAVGLLAGCSLGPNDHLRVLMKEVALPGSSSFDCEWGASSFKSEPKSWYGCWDYVPGDLEHVSQTVQSRLIARHFAVWRRRSALTVEFSALRDSDVLCVDVLARGFARGRNTSPSEVDISPGEVFVDIWTTTPRIAPPGRIRPACAALPPFPDE
jgi:hypothetical protein